MKTWLARLLTSPDGSPDPGALIGLVFMSIFIGAGGMWAWQLHWQIPFTEFTTDLREFGTWIMGTFYAGNAINHVAVGIKGNLNGTSGQSS